MRLQAFQPFERRDENDNIIRSGAYGKHTPLATRDNMGIIDYIGNNFDAIVSLLDLIKGGLNIKGAYGSLHELQAAHPTGNAGDAYMVSGHLYAWVNNRWTDLGNIQGPQGEPGPKGNDGTSLTVKGKYNSLYELQAAHPTGNLGDAYMVGMNMYVWTGAEWSDMGNITGPRGERGPKGDRGDVGPQGPQGLQGEQGIQGPSGRTGERGTQGPIGAVGPKGEKGDVGPRGLQGEQGPRGPQGLQGNVGPQGPRGERGPKGEQGTGLVVRGKYNSLYELQTAHPTANDGDAYLVGTDLYVWVSGTWTNMGSLQGPKGDKGERGPQGVQGNAGPKGESGQPGTSASITGATASVDNTSGVPSVEVVTGGTYYTRSFDFRFKGLKGPKGDKGDVGPRGPQGLKGDTGAVGPQGPQGLTGPAGPRGPQGLQGAAGPKGDKGDAGPRGPQGPAADLGNVPQLTGSSANQFLIDNQFFGTVQQGVIKKVEADIPNLGNIGADVLNLTLTSGNAVTIDARKIFGIVARGVSRVCLIVLTGTASAIITWANCKLCCDAPTKEASKDTIVTFYIDTDTVYLVSASKVV